MTTPTEATTALLTVDTDRARELAMAMQAAVSGQPDAEAIAGLILLLSHFAITSAEDRATAEVLALLWGKTLIDSVRDNWERKGTRLQ